MKQALTEMGIYFPRRFKTKNKNNFINYFVNKLKEKNIEYRIIGSSGRVNGHHLCIGDLENASYVILAYYDTADIMLLKNYRYTPLDAENAAKKERLNSLLYAAVSILLLAVIAMLTWKIKTATLFLKIVIGLTDIILGCFAAKTAKGIEKKINMNANSSSLAVLYKLLMSKKLKKTAVILVDNAAMLSRGYQDIRMLQEIEDKKIIVLNSIGCGKDLMICTNLNTDGLGKDLCRHLKGAELIRLTQNEYEKTVAGMFENSLMIFSADKQDGVIVIENTRNRKDFKVDVERLEDIEKALSETLM